MTDSLFDFTPSGTPIIYAHGTHTQTPRRRAVYQSAPLCIPYLGNKAAMVNDLMRFFTSEKPHATHFIDLFGGGASVSLAARLAGYEVHYNELNRRVYALFHYLIKHRPLSNKDPKWLKFYTREEFHAMEDFTPQNEADEALRAMVLQCYSFGNLGRTYAFGKDIEHLKRRGHEFIVNLSAEACEFWQRHYARSLDYIFPQMLRACETLDIWQRREMWSRLVLKIEAIKVADLRDFYAPKIKTIKDLESYKQKQMCADIDRLRPNIEKKYYESARGGGLSELQRLEQLERLQRLQQLERLQQLKQLEQLERVERLQQLEQLERLQRLQRVEQLQHLHQLQHLQHLQYLQQLKQLERLQRVEQLQQLQRLERLNHLESNAPLIQGLHTTNLDYRAALAQIESSGVDLHDALIYCDIPYKNTQKYEGVPSFNHDEFVAWILALRERGIDVYFSEYSGLGFPCVFERAKRVGLASKANLAKTSTGGGVERVFINKGGK